MAEIVNHPQGRWPRAMEALPLPRACRRCSICRDLRLRGRHPPPARLFGSNEPVRIRRPQHGRSAAPAAPAINLNQDHGRHSTPRTSATAHQHPPHSAESKAFGLPAMAIAVLDEAGQPQGPSRAKTGASMFRFENRAGQGLGRRWHGGLESRAWRSAPKGQP